MARALWRGSLSFGLVNVPVQMVSAVRDRDVHFHQVRKGSGERVQIKRVAATTGDEVPWKQIAKGWETEDGELVVLTDEDFAAAAPERTRTIDIDVFVALGDIDPVVFDHPYWLLPVGEGEGAVRAYRLLRDTLRDSDRVAIARMVLRAREYLVALREQRGLLSLTTMRFADEIRDPQEIDAIPRGATGKPTAREVADSVALIEELTDDFQPRRYKDGHRARLRRLIEQKRKGGKIKLQPPEPQPALQTVPADLLRALQESLEQARGGRGQRSEWARQPAGR